MARVTVEDCVDKVDNRFELVLLAGHRARVISGGAALTVDRDNDKNPVVALREIASETLQPGDIKQSLIESMQRNVEVDEPDQPQPMLPSMMAAPFTGSMTADDQPDVDMGAAFESMSEEELLRGLEQMKPPSAHDDDD